MEKKRYIVTTSFYVYAENDEQVVKQGKYLAAQQSTKRDDRCSVDKIVEMPVGTIKKREIKIN